MKKKYIAVITFKMNRQQIYVDEFGHEYDDPCWDSCYLFDTENDAISFGKLYYGERPEVIQISATESAEEE